ncbi:hypothetical protein [Nocardia aurantiaca]|uniref:Uncharacterized protein n=1 Tax=Nocardia aurantiaca TaxID=2675850 RepID=A0A6I3KRR9_9NOCA|nr:hypothetical protein [Nocardia aurantiaca]MTE11508.1 hypothetical protein [Nocardia aurantiaca]
MNERQRIYLTVLFHADQDIEEHRHRMAATGRWDSSPARDWRRIAFNNAYGPVASALRARGVYDSGAGSTLAALRERGLITTETAPGILRDPGLGMAHQSRPCRRPRRHRHPTRAK